MRSGLMGKMYVDRQRLQALCGGRQFCSDAKAENEWLKTSQTRCDHMIDGSQFTEKDVRNINESGFTGQSLLSGQEITNFVLASPKVNSLN